MSGESVTLGGSQRSLRSAASSISPHHRRHGAGSGRMMHHSHSTPAGVDGVASSSSLGRSSVPGTPRKPGKMLAIRVLMLDETTTIFQIQSKALGRLLFEQVCRQLNLLEEDYFGLEYEEHNGTKYWLDLEKPMCRQVGFSLADPFLRFCVKFYTPDPGQLEEEFTRYLFCLQIKRDLSDGSLTCNAHTAALLSSYIVQSECGDYVAEDYPNHTYLSHYKFTPKQDDILERRIMENHKKHMGQSPAQADMNLLETARRCESYGMKMHPAKDNEGAPLNLAVAHMGIVVFQNTTKINTFSWAKIRKISFKRKRFLVKLHHDVYGHYKDTMEFIFDGRNECKNFWKKCVENHGFFRCTTVKRVPRHKTRVLSRGSSFRYSGKTQRQMVEYVRDNYVKRQTFQRSQSFRHSSAGLTSMSASSAHSVNASISANPLLPLADPVELTCQLPSWSSTSGSQMMRETEVSPPRSIRTGYSSSPAHPHAATTLNSIQVETYAMPAASSHIVNSSNTPSIPVQTLVASKALIQQEHDKSFQSQVSNNKNGSLNQQESSSAHADLIHAARIRNCDTGVALIENQTQLDNNNSYIVNQSTSMYSNTEKNSISDKENSLDNKTFKKNCIVSNINEKTDVKIKSNGTKTNSDASVNSDAEMKKKKWPSGKSYYIAKEMLMTERTYKNDLDVITMWFRKYRSLDESNSSLNLLNEPHFATLSALGEALCAYHGILLHDIEQRLAQWESRSAAASSHHHHRICDILLKHLAILQPLYEDYLESHFIVLQKLEESFWSDAQFQQFYRDFELQKVCYLPFTEFLLKPLQRILHYKLLIDRLLDIYPTNHLDRDNCENVNAILLQIAKDIKDVFPGSENFVQLCEFQRDIVGFDNLVQEDRQLIRIGCLLKHSTHGGLQQRIFFLFSDIMLFASKNPKLQTFKIHGHIPLRALLLKDGDDPSSFVIFGGTKSLTVNSNSESEKLKWIHDITEAVQNAKNHGNSKANYLSLKSCSSSEEIMDLCGLDLSVSNVSSQRNNTSLHVCWHRATTITLQDQIIQAENQMSGYLLRKFKNSTGWQKLWVVFTSFCLYFYKTYQDEAPLASLPLLGYQIGPPSAQDEINKDYVFKLTFKNHIYFFRAESQHTYLRWMEVIGSIKS